MELCCLDGINTSELYTLVVICTLSTFTGALICRFFVIPRLLPVLAFCDAKIF